MSTGFSTAPPKVLQATTYRDVVFGKSVIDSEGFSLAARDKKLPEKQDKGVFSRFILNDLHHGGALEPTTDIVKHATESSSVENMQYGLTDCTLDSQPICGFWKMRREGRSLLLSARGLTRFKPLKDYREHTGFDYYHANEMTISDYADTDLIKRVDCLFPSIADTVSEIPSDIALDHFDTSTEMGTEGS